MGKYEPPYPLSKLPQHLQDDPVHSWRAETGIELIHEEPDWDEYQRIQRNWQLMTPEQKAISDAKAVELFGVDNMTYAKHIRVRKSQRSWRIASPVYGTNTTIGKNEETMNTRYEKIKIAGHTASANENRSKTRIYRKWKMLLNEFERRIDHSHDDTMTIVNRDILYSVHDELKTLVANLKAERGK